MSFIFQAASSAASRQGLSYLVSASPLLFTLAVSSSDAARTSKGNSLCTGLLMQTCFPFMITLTLAPLTSLSLPVISLSTTANFQLPLCAFIVKCNWISYGLKNLTSCNSLVDLSNTLAAISSKNVAAPGSDTFISSHKCSRSGLPLQLLLAMTEVFFRRSSVRELKLPLRGYYTHTLEV